MERPIKIAVIGGRDYKDITFLESVLDKMHNDFTIDTIISGGAVGTDTLAEIWAQLNEVNTIIHLAKWDDVNHSDAHVKINKYGKPYDAKAGHRRNKFIIDDSTGVVAFWDSKSPGTNNSLNYAKSIGKPCVVYLYENGKVHGKFNLLLEDSYVRLNVE